MTNYDYKKDNEKQIMSRNIYHPNDSYNVPGWTMVKHVKNDNNGFEGQIYQNGNNTVVVFKGTDNFLGKDGVTDAQMLFKNVPNQQQDAHNLVLEAKRMNPNANIEITGHSLGGSMAQIESVRTGIPATTFNAFGTGEILKKEGFSNIDLQNANIKNYGNPKDGIFAINANTHPGKTYITNTNLKSDYTYDAILDDKLERNEEFNSIKNHYLEQMDSLENSIKINSIRRENNAPEVLNGYIYKIDDIFQPADNPNLKPFTAEEIGKMTTEEFLKNESEINRQLQEGLISPSGLGVKNYADFVNPETGSDKIYTREEIGSLSPDDFKKNEKEIFAQMNSPIGIPTEGELKNAASSGGGVVFVNGYTRSDGVEVKSYYRSSPSN